MNRRIRKKKEKQSLMEGSFELVPEYPYKKRKRIVDREWKQYHDAGIGIVIGYKRKPVEE